MKILSPQHQQLDFSWARLSSATREHLACFAAALILSCASALLALFIITRLAPSAEAQDAATATPQQQQQQQNG